MEWTASAPRNIKKTPSTRLAVQRLEDESENSVSLAALADLCGLNRFQLLRSFSKDMGVTPHAYPIQLRVRKARRLLAIGKSPAEAALLTGFADQSHLTRAFAPAVWCDAGSLSGRTSVDGGCNILQDEWTGRTRYWH